MNDDKVVFIQIRGMKHTASVAYGSKFQIMCFVPCTYFFPVVYHWITLKCLQIIKWF